MIALSKQRRSGVSGDMTIYDLSRIIDSRHYRWPIKIETNEERLTDRKFTVSRLSFTSHVFTHIDAFKHTIPNGMPIDEMGVDRFLGEGYVADLSSKSDGDEIDDDDLARFETEVRKGDILILSTQWDSKREFYSDEFWKFSPFVSFNAAKWILSKELKAVGYDFPQDYEIRKYDNPKKSDGPSWPLHELLPSHNIYQIEYLHIPKEILSKRVYVVALPLKLKGCDGSPARVICKLI